MASLHSIFQDITLIISDTSDNNILMERILKNSFDWEKIIPVASSHLIIPLIYFKLKEKGLLHLLPVDLKSYLKEIARQNTERNKIILQEVKEISLLLNSKNIDHVFLKGAAMLAAGIYTHIGERMIGDIDILVKSDQLLIAQEAFIKTEYTQAEKSLTDKYFEQKHLPRLIPEKKLAAIELHRRILQKPIDKIFQPERILKNKIICNGIHIPDNYTLYLHSMLNFEINDLGYYYNYIGLRNTHDALLLIQDLPETQISKSLKNKYVRSFFNKVTCYFKVDKLTNYGLKSNLSKSIFILKQKQNFWSKVHLSVFNLLDVVGLILNRLYIFVTNPSYRKESFKKRKKILKFIKSRINLV